MTFCFVGNGEEEKERKKKKKKKGKRSHYYSRWVPGVDLKALFPVLAAKLNSDPPTTSWEDTALKAAAAPQLTPNSVPALFLGAGGCCWGPAPATTCSCPALSLPAQPARGTQG